MGTEGERLSFQSVLFGNSRCLVSSDGVTQFVATLRIFTPSLPKVSMAKALTESWAGSGGALSRVVTVVGYNFVEPPLYPKDLWGNLAYSPEGYDGHHCFSKAVVTCLVPGRLDLSGLVRLKVAEVISGAMKKALALELLQMSPFPADPRDIPLPRGTKDALHLRYLRQSKEAPQIYKDDEQTIRKALASRGAQLQSFDDQAFGSESREVTVQVIWVKGVTERDRTAITDLLRLKLSWSRCDEASWMVR